jgi:hypothetical protein
MFDNLSNLGYGLITFAIIIGVGVIVLQKFTAAVGCDAGYTFNESATMGGGAECYETANVSNEVSYNTAGSNTNYLNTQLGTAGLAGWTPAIIALSVGMLFLGVFLSRDERKV